MERSQKIKHQNPKHKQTPTQLESNIMLARTSTYTSPSAALANSCSTAVDNTITDLEQQIASVEAAILPLRTMTTKKLNKLEKELSNCNFLMDSGIGAKSDQAALRKTKRQLRTRRIQLWKDLEVLPSLEAERDEILRQLVDYRRRHGVMDS